MRNIVVYESIRVRRYHHDAEHTSGIFLRFVGNGAEVAICTEGTVHVAHVTVREDDEGEPCFQLIEFA